MNLFDGLNENILDLKESLGSIANKIEKNSKQIKDQTQIKVEISKEQRNLNFLYKSLGELFYKIEKGDNERSEDKISNIMRDIDISLSRIEALNKKYEYIKSFDYSSNSYTSVDKKYLDINEKE